MKAILEFNKKTSCPLSKKMLEKVIQKTIVASDYEFLKSKKITISVAIVAEKEIRKINKKYRKKDKATDILSFSNYQDKTAIKKEKNKDFFLGELIVCCEYIKKSAKINTVTVKQELIYVVSHGVLHLLGFQHGKKMYAVQDEIVNIIK